MYQHPQHSRSLTPRKPPEALSSGTDLSMAKRELQVLRDAQEAASQRVQALVIFAGEKMWEIYGKCWEYHCESWGEKPPNHLLDGVFHQETIHKWGTTIYMETTIWENLGI
jgi:hypothetical protein